MVRRTVMRESIASREIRTVYRLGGIMYVPHYTEECYVAPGFTTDRSRRYTAQQLLDAGAKPELKLMFIRTNPTKEN
jgi:hypothetical protein